jgi:hypothetical protein
MVTEFEWSDPPPQPRGNRTDTGYVQRTIIELQKHPGKWALVRRNRAASGGSVWRKAGCEVVTRRTTTVDDRRDRVDIWARWPEM